MMGSGVVTRVGTWKLVVAFAVARGGGQWSQGTIDIVMMLDHGAATLVEARRALDVIEEEHRAFLDGPRLRAVGG
jgi:hypothetical protein